jgi:hypothetical protein
MPPSARNNGMLVARRFVRAVCILAMICFVNCNNCNKGGRTGDTPMCGACVQSAECRTGLSCVNGVCETAPPSCHVRIGL